MINHSRIPILPKKENILGILGGGQFGKMIAIADQMLL